eukprot:TRINITY_DN14939_c0_g1_i1.p1 TRINITY_DN14939_c0_g1~~TRINITY_DN14939_c0_g1_i1.p1  ORF type:complete len:157 (+),score=9.76 TRINITY_DN14939_c0_g1_i1:33-473(+)
MVAVLIDEEALDSNFTAIQSLYFSLDVLSLVMILYIFKNLVESINTQKESKQATTVRSQQMRQESLSLTTVHQLSPSSRIDIDFMSSSTVEMNERLRRDSLSSTALSATESLSRDSPDARMFKGESEELDPTSYSPRVFDTPTLPP